MLLLLDVDLGHLERSLDVGPVEGPPWQEGLRGSSEGH